MLYCIIGEDRANSLNARLQHRPAHLQRLQDLQDQGRLILAGPMPAIDSEEPGPAGFQGSIIIAEFCRGCGRLGRTGPLPDRRRLRSCHGTPVQTGPAAPIKQYTIDAVNEL